MNDSKNDKNKMGRKKLDENKFQILRIVWKDKEIARVD